MPAKTRPAGCPAPPPGHRLAGGYPGAAATIVETGRQCDPHPAPSCAYRQALDGHADFARAQNQPQHLLQHSSHAGVERDAGIRPRYQVLHAGAGRGRSRQIGALPRGGGGNFLNVMQPSLERLGDRLWRHRYDLAPYRRRPPDAGPYRREWRGRTPACAAEPAGAAGRRQRPGHGGFLGGLDEDEICERFPLLKWSRPVDIDDYLAQVAKRRGRRAGRSTRERRRRHLLRRGADLQYRRHHPWTLVATTVSGQHDKKTTQKIVAEVAPGRHFHPYRTTASTARFSGAAF